MRLIGHISNEKSAQIFCDYLHGLGIECHVEGGADGALEAWVYHEEQVVEAKRQLDDFLQRSTDPFFSQYRGSRQDFLKKQHREHVRARKRNIDIRTSWHLRSTLFSKLGPVTVVLIVLSCAVSLISRMGSDINSIHYLFITEIEVGDVWMFSQPLLEVLRAGQVWRLFTPMFIHFGFIHLLFNMWWLKDLGGLIEQRHGSAYLLILVLVAESTSGVAQYLVSGPLHGGMSGVIYALFGFLWMRGKFDPHYGMTLNPQVVFVLVAWFFICLTGVIGPIANTSHGGGLVVGMLWGYASAILAARR